MSDSDLCTVGDTLWRSGCSWHTSKRAVDLETQDLGPSAEICGSRSISHITPFAWVGFSWLYRLVLPFSFFFPPLPPRFLFRSGCEPPSPALAPPLQRLLFIWDVQFTLRNPTEKRKIDKKTLKHNTKGRDFFFCFLPGGICRTQWVCVYINIYIIYINIYNTDFKKRQKKKKPTKKGKKKRKEKKKRKSRFPTTYIFF